MEGEVSMVQPTGKGPKCLVHKSNGHTAEECNSYANMDAGTRLKLIRENRGCWSCLKLGHMLNSCLNKTTCNVENCDQFHHMSLHDAFHVESGFHCSAVVPGDDNDHMTSTSRLQIMKIRSNDTYLNVLWDTGATISLITFKRTRELRIKRGMMVNLTVGKVGGHIERITSFLYMVPLTNRYGKVIHIRAYGIERISSKMEYIEVNNIVNLFKKLNLSEVRRPKGEVDVLIGTDYYVMHPDKEQIIDTLVLCTNQFGKCLTGHHKLLKERMQPSINHAYINKAMDPTIRDFFDIEEMGVNCTPKCGGCKCGKCPLGGKNYSIKEERELI